MLCYHFEFEFKTDCEKEISGGYISGVDSVPAPNCRTSIGLSGWRDGKMKSSKLIFLKDQSLVQSPRYIKSRADV